MMATMLSSPIGPGPGHYDPFEQPSSPKLKHEELPNEFGDQSFGSSMSLGSSFELSRMVNSSSSSSHLSNLAAQRNRTSSEDQYTIRLTTRKSPPRLGQDSLGAAMGTVLNSRSPGLAAKMSSVDDMDMSSPPTAGRHQLVATPSKTGDGRLDEDELLPPGSAMKEDTPVRPPFPSRRSTSETTASTGGSLGRLFGTELSLNARHQSFQAAPSACLGDESFGLQVSPDKEPPLKKRPSSLPLSHATVPSRPSLRSVGMAPPASSSSTSSRRPNLLKSMTTGQSSEATTAGKRLSLESLRLQNRASDSVLPTAKTLAAGRSSRSRSGSTERSEKRELAPQLQRTSMPPLHPTIVESPSPSTLQHEGFGTYFFDPQSPEHDRQTLSQQNSISTQLTTDAQQLSRPRLFAKAASSVIVPSMKSATGQSSLGKRSNPYGKRPKLSAVQGAHLRSEAYAPAASSSAVPTSLARTTIPAPRRCQSALDNSATFAQAEDMSMSSIDGGDHSVHLSPTDIRTGQKTLEARTFPPGFDASGSPIAPSARSKARPGMHRRPSKDDSSPLGYGQSKRFMANNTDGLSACNEPGSSVSPYRSAEGLPGFGASEREGKILPCFNVKDDGLMRITPSTLVEVLKGQYQGQTDGYQIIDCRFGYEYDGGHISGAINLSTMERVKRYFLQPDNGQKLPRRSQSGKADETGEGKKKVLIFHCEFSCKRAPSMALALRQADRSLAQDYPNCHYPEVYILQGGYCGFFKTFADACEPKFYVQMDDPKFQDKRSKELNGFRKQFARHRSFTYGDSNRVQLSHSDGMLLNNPSFVRTTIKEEESSFENSASPSAVQADAALARRKVTTKGGSGGSGSSAFRGLGIKPVLLASAPITAADLSFGSSVGDSSFEGGPTESPCAAAARRPNPVNFKENRDGASSMVGGRQPFQRATTASHIHMR